MRTIQAAEMEYGPEEILALREEVITLRDQALEQACFSEAVGLSHVIALMHAFAEELRK